jgi:hypothetical protein
VAFDKQNGTKTSFENKILRFIYGPVYDNDLGCWHRRKNKETRELTRITRITNFVKAKEYNGLGT